MGSEVGPPGVDLRSNVRCTKEQSGNECGLRELHGSRGGGWCEQYPVTVKAVRGGGPLPSDRDDLAPAPMFDTRRGLQRVGQRALVNPFDFVVHEGAGHQPLIHRTLPISGGISLASELPAGSVATLARASDYAGQWGLLIVYRVIDDGLATDIPSAQAYLSTQSSEQIAAYMRSKSADFVLHTVLTRLVPLGASGSGPIPDGNVVPTSPIAAIKAGKYAKVPVLIGNARDEGKLFPTLFPLAGGTGSARLLSDAQVFSTAFGYQPDAAPQSTLEQ